MSSSSTPIVFDIVVPGTWLQSPNKDWAWKVQGQLDLLVSQFFEANLALNLFMSCRRLAPAMPTPEDWERRNQRRREIEREIERERGITNRSDREVMEAVWFESEVRLKHELWANGTIPKEFEHNRPFIYARAFLYALDVFDRLLGALTKEPGVPAGLSDLHDGFGKAFPDLRGVRNTVQHIEDRSRGLGAGAKPKPLDLKPVTAGGIYAPGGGALVLNHLHGSKYGSTMADGRYGEVDVSPESVEQLCGILRDVLQSFQWCGPKQHKPSV